MWISFWLVLAFGVDWQFGVEKRFLHFGRDANVLGVGLAAGDGSDDEKGFGGGDDRWRERGIGRLVREIFVAGEEAEEGAALAGGVVADGSAELGEPELDGV
jgi:hypothetical protein